MTDQTVMNGSTADHLHEPVVRYARRDFPIIRNTLTVGEALGVIRRVGVGERIIYFYVIDDGGRLVGIVPTRRLLTSAQEVMIGDVMVTNVITLPEEATVFEALELFVKKKFLAFPIVNQEGQIIGVIDIGFFSDEQVSIVERQHIEDIFQLIGFGIEQLRGRSVFGVFRYRFPWLLATIMSGTTCALLAGYYQTTLAETIVLAFFLTLVLGLGESVSIQSMTVALQKLNFWQTIAGKLTFLVAQRSIRYGTSRPGLWGSGRILCLAVARGDRARIGHQLEHLFGDCRSRCYRLEYSYTVACDARGLEDRSGTDHISTGGYNDLAFLPKRGKVALVGESCVEVDLLPERAGRDSSCDFV